MPRYSLALAVLALTACPTAPRQVDAADAGSVAEPALTYEEWLDSAFQCPNEFACRKWTSEAKCEEAMRTAMHHLATVLDEEGDLRKGFYKFDGVAAYKLVTWWRSQRRCRREGPHPMDPVFVGVVPIGGACGHAQCVPEAYCDTKDGCICRPRLGVGEDVPKGLGDACAKGLSVYGGRCTERLPEGSDCSPTIEGEYNRPCEWAADGTPVSCIDGRCTRVRLVDIGEACERRNDYCGLNGLCWNGVCSPFAGLGDTCSNGPTFEGRPCKSDFICDQGLHVPVCVEPPKEGEPCVFGQCDDPFFAGVQHCDHSTFEGICRRQPTVGESCAAGKRCDFSFCDPASEICVPYRAHGEACTGQFRECGSLPCVDGKCKYPACWQ